MRATIVTRTGRPKISKAGVIFVAPAVIAFLLFKYIPLGQAFFMSFFNYSVMEPPGKFVGLSHYTQLLQTRTFWEIGYNTVIFFVLYTLLTFWVPIVQALFLNEIRRANVFYRFLYLAPTAVPAVAGFILWKWIYNPDFGLMNYWLSKISLGPFTWLNDPQFVKFAIVLPGMLGGGISLLIYFSALRGVSPDLVEAAKIDGAGPWRVLVSVMLPGIRYIIGVQFVAFMAGSFLVFDPMFVMTGGGPMNKSRVLSMLVYESAFKEFQFGVAGAVSCIMFVFVGSLTYIQLKLSQYSAN